MSIASSPAGELDRDRIRELGERERSTLARRTPRSAEPGPRGTIADVGGVLVGHVTVVRDEADPPAARGVARSGVTAIVPRAPETLRSQPLAAGVAVLNGAGEMTGSLAIGEWGVLQTPVYLTATMSVGRLYDGAVAAAVAADPGGGVDDVVIPVVAECDDSWLSDARVVQVEADDAGRSRRTTPAGRWRRR